MTFDLKWPWSLGKCYNPVEYTFLYKMTPFSSVSAQNWLIYSQISVQRPHPSAISVKSKMVYKIGTCWPRVVKFCVESSFDRTTCCAKFHQNRRKWGFSFAYYKWNPTLVTSAGIRFISWLWLPLLSPTFLSYTCTWKSNCTHVLKITFDATRRVAKKGPLKRKCTTTPSIGRIFL